MNIKECKSQLRELAKVLEDDMERHNVHTQLSDLIEKMWGTTRYHFEKKALRQSAIEEKATAEKARVREKYFMDVAERVSTSMAEQAENPSLATELVMDQYEKGFEEFDNDLFIQEYRFLTEGTEMVFHDGQQADEAPDGTGEEAASDTVGGGTHSV